MNLGLILSKPGESNLALASRLWIANRYSWHIDSMHISDRIEEEIQSQPFLAAIDCDVRGLDRVRFIETSHFPNIPKPNLPTFLKFNEKRRNCPSCAQSGYHAIYYDFPWMHECPIHHKPLIDHCPKCHMPWPTPEDVHLRQCNLCGIRNKSMLSKPNLSRIQKISDNSIYESIKELDIFFNQTVAFAQPVWRQHFHLFTGRSSDHTKTMLYPSVLTTHQYSNFEEWQSSLPISEALYKCTKHSFKIDTKYRKYWLSYIDDSTRVQLSNIRKDVFMRAEKRLEELANHEIGSCKGSEQSGLHENCYYCDLYVYLKDAFYQYADSQGHFADYSIRGLGKFKYGDPGLISYLKDFGDAINSENSRMLAVPRSIQFKVYELDIISSVKRLGFQIVISRHREARNLLKIDEYGTQRILENSYGYTNHYFFIVGAKDVTLYYPDEYDCFSFDCLDRWLSMTRSY